jgi:hypothetical protein
MRSPCAQAGGEVERYSARSRLDDLLLHPPVQEFGDVERVLRRVRQALWIFSTLSIVILLHNYMLWSDDRPSRAGGAAP